MCKLYLYQIQDDYQQQLRVNNGMTVLTPPGNCGVTYINAPEIMINNTIKK